jgi:hypothetical protein
VYSKIEERVRRKEERDVYLFFSIFSLSCQRCRRGSVFNFFRHCEPPFDSHLKSTLYVMPNPRSNLLALSSWCGEFVNALETSFLLVSEMRLLRQEFLPTYYSSFVKFLSPLLAMTAKCNEVTNERKWLFKQINKGILTYG